MKRSWTGSMVAVGVAVTLIGAGVGLAKRPDDAGPGKSRGHGGKHGDPGDEQGERGKGGGPGTGGGKGKGGGAGACDAASSAIQAFVDAACPCAGLDDGAGGTTAWKNHGQYVRCVAHAVREAARAAGVKRRCAKNVVPCAARSTCGSKKRVTCVVAATGTCTAGACSNDPDVPCVVDADCSTQSCAVTSADRCADAGGVAGTGSCCAASPSGAFLD